MTVIQKLKELGYSTISEDFYTQIGAWASWYVGKVKGFHQYREYNGHKWAKRDRASLGMAKKVCEDWANLLMNEKVKIALEGKKEQEFVDRVFSKNNFWVKANEIQEMKSALGTAAYVPRVTGQQVQSDTGTVTGSGDIAMDYVTAEHIFPLAWSNGIITECAFDSEYTVDGKRYLYLQIHRLDENGLYVIENRIYTYENESLSSEIELTSVKGFERVAPIVYTQSVERQFVVDRLNIANNYDSSSPMGISVFANAVDVLKGVDKAYDCYANEFENGPMIMMVKMPATKWEDGEPTLDDNDRRFYLLPEDTSLGNVVETVAPELRTDRLSVGLRDQLNILSAKCGFGENHYRFDANGVTTATQVISENSTMFRTLKKHEIILESVLKELCRVILRLGNTAFRAGLNEDVEISIDFDDSIIEDKQADFSRDMQLLNAGILNDWEFRMKWMNEDEATAKAALPGAEELTDEDQDEVE